MGDSDKPHLVTLIEPPKPWWKRIASILLGFVVVVPFLALGVSYYALRVAGSQLEGVQRNQFYDATTKALDLYCPGGDTATLFELHGHIDRAAALEPVIAKDLVASDYLVLASVGANFWPYPKCHQYGRRALELATLTDDRANLFTANMILGTIDLAEYRKTKNSQMLTRGNQYLGAAEKLAMEFQTPSNHHLLSQLYQFWAAFEPAELRHPERTHRAAMAVEQMQLAPGRGSVVLIKDFQDAIAKNDIPRFPCPRNLSFLPATGIGSSLAETAGSNARDRNDGVANVRFDQLEQRFNDFEDRVKTSSTVLLERISRVEELAITNSPASNDDGQNDADLSPPQSGPETSGIAPAPPSRGESNEPQDSQGFRPPNKVDPFPPHPGLPCRVKLVNNTPVVLHPIINGVDRDDYSIQAFSEKGYWVQNDWLILGRRGSSNRKGFGPESFSKIDGTPIEPIVIATTCCFSLKESAD